MEILKNQITEILTGATGTDIMEINNQYAQNCNFQDSEIYFNDEEFFSMFYPNAGDGLKVAQAVFYGDYNYSHEYVVFNGYGNLQSFSYLDSNNLCELIDNIADDIMNDYNSYSHINILSNLSI